MLKTHENYISCDSVAQSEIVITNGQKRPIDRGYWTVTVASPMAHDHIDQENLEKYVALFS